MRFVTLVILLLITVRHAKAQWLSMDQFDAWEKVINDEYGLSPDSITSQKGALTKAQMLKRNQTMVLGFEKQIQAGLTLLRSPRPIGLKYLRPDDKATDRDKAGIEAHNDEVIREKERYLYARTHAATMLALYHDNYPKLQPYNDFVVREIRRPVQCQRPGSGIECAENFKGPPG